MLEAALPEEVAGPYREQLTRLQDSAPPMPTQQVREALARDLGADWKRAARLAGRRSDRGRLDRPGAPRTLARRPRGRGQGAVPRRRRRAPLRPAPALALARTIGQLVPGIDVKPLIAEMQARAEEELDYRLEAEAQRAFAAAFRDDPEIAVPDVLVAGDTPWSPSGWRALVAGRGHPRRHPGGARPLRRALRALPLRRARRAPACCTPTRTPATSGCCPTEDGQPGRMGVLDFGAVARLADGGLPWRWGR